jgi:hypothetical protein
VTPCSAPNMVCSGVCLDVSSDVTNCGRCGNACAAGQFCMGGTCMAPSSGALDPGRPCVQNSDCPGGGECGPGALGFPGGYCLYGCPMGDPDGSECGPTGVCIQFGTGPTAQNICQRECTSDAGCRSGYFCQPVGSVAFCRQRCEATPSSCGAALCNTTTHSCNAMCSSSTQCSSGSTCSGSVCRCTASTLCGTNRRCYTATGTCGCSNDAGCGRSDLRCNTTTGPCEVR